MYIIIVTLSDKVLRFLDTHTYQVRPSFRYFPSSSPTPSLCPLPVSPTIIPRRKRQTGTVTNLRTEWLSNSHARLSWRHFAEREPPEGTYYAITHGALVVAGGKVFTTYQFFTVSRQSTSFTLQEVCRNNFNIFTVTTTTPSIIHASIHLSGKYFPWHGMSCMNYTTTCVLIYMKILLQLLHLIFYFPLYHTKPYIQMPLSYERHKADIFRMQYLVTGSNTECHILLLQAVQDAISCY